MTTPAPTIDPEVTKFYRAADSARYAYEDYGNDDYLADFEAFSRLAVARRYSSVAAPADLARWQVNGARWGN